MYCSKCGNQVNDNDKFCSKCGAPINHIINQEAIKQTSGNEPDYDALPSIQIDGAKVNYVGNNIKTKSKLVAALLAFFVGNLGIHNFYLNRYKRAGVQLTLSIIMAVILFINYILVLTIPSYINSMGTSIIIILNWIINGSVRLWSFVEFIIILADKNKLETSKHEQIVWDKN